MPRVEFLPHNIRACLCGFAVLIVGQIPLVAVQGPPIRTGVWVMERVAENAGELSKFEVKIRENPDVTGVCLHIGWKDIEKEPGHWDFSAIDKTVAVLRRIGRKYELGIKPGPDTPPFVYEEASQSFPTHVTNPHRPNFTQPI